MEHDIVVNQSIQHLFFCTKACRFIKMNIIMVNISCKLKNVYYDRDIEKYRHFVNTSHEFCVLTIYRIDISKH